MPTRYYLPSAGTPAITPAVATDWEQTPSGFVRRPMATSKSNSAMTSLTSNVTSSASSPLDAVASQYVGPPIGAQTISGTVLAQLRAAENATGNDYEPQLVIRVLSGDGATVRGTLLGADTNNVADAHEFPRLGTIGLQNRQFPRGGSATLTPVVAQNGDRIVVEVGCRCLNTVNLTQAATYRFGDPTGSTDLAQDETSTLDNAPWIEFSMTIAGPAALINAPFIAAVSAAYDPALTPAGTATIAAPFIAPETVAYAPTVVPHNVIAIPFIPAGTVLYPPAIGVRVQGIVIAPGDGVFVAGPSWERIDLAYRVQSFTIDRGRPNEMSRTDTGTATIELVDRTGDFDPTNLTSAFYGRLQPGEPMGPLVQAAIGLQNPITGEWSTLFRGFISRIVWSPYRTQEFANVSLELVDGLALLAAAEMAPVASFGMDFVEGNIVFYEDQHLDAVQTRINWVLDQVGWPSVLRAVNTGNVWLWESRYAPRSSVLSVILDAADADFPDVANVWIGGPRNPGKLVFHGRKARFNPADVEYGIRTWQLGDDANAEGLANVVPISPPLTASLDDTLLYTSALATDAQINDEDIGAQYVTDGPAVDRKGLRTWSAEGLATAKGETTSSAEAETRLFADYVRDNYKRPRTRVGQLTIKSRRPNDFHGAAVWKLLSEIDISDRVQLTTTHPGGGGFADPFYVEGIHYAARPGGPGLWFIELTLDVSPAGYYDANPWA